MFMLTLGVILQLENPIEVLSQNLNNFRGEIFVKSVVIGYQNAVIPYISD